MLSNILSALFGLIIFWSLLLLLLAGLFWFAHQQNLNHWLRYCGIETKAKVTAKRAEGTGRRGYYFYIQYGYTVDGSMKRLSHKQSVNAKTYVHISEGQTIKATYYSSSPKFARLNDEIAYGADYRIARNLVYFLMIFGCIIFYPFLLYGDRLFEEFRLIRLLKKNGRHTTAIITAKENPTRSIFILTGEFTYQSKRIPFKQQVSANIYQKIQEWNTVDVTFLAKYPTAVRLRGEYMDKVMVRKLVVDALLALALPVSVMIANTRLFH